MTKIFPGGKILVMIISLVIEKKIKRFKKIKIFELKKLTKNYFKNTEIIRFSFIFNFYDLFICIFHKPLNDVNK